MQELRWPYLQGARHQALYHPVAMGLQGPRRRALCHPVAMGPRARADQRHHTVTRPAQCEDHHQTAARLLPLVVACIATLCRQTTLALQSWELRSWDRHPHQGQVTRAATAHYQNLRLPPKFPGLAFPWATFAMATTHQRGHYDMARPSLKISMPPSAAKMARLEHLHQR